CRLHFGTAACAVAAGHVAEKLGLAPNNIVEQGQTACCYAKSEKSWIDDPAGISWLSFHLDRLRFAGLVSVRRDGRSMIYAARFVPFPPSPRTVAKAAACIPMRSRTRRWEGTSAAPRQALSVRPIPGAGSRADCLTANGASLAAPVMTAS